jgi:hypothetical protein
MTELAPDDNLPNWHLEKAKAGRITLDGRYTGHIYKDKNTGENVYVTFKRKKNMFGNLGSHAIEISILDEIQEKWDVSEIIVFEDTGTAYVFDIETYRNAEDIEYDPFGPQRAPHITTCEKSYEGVSEILKTRYPQQVKLD